MTLELKKILYVDDDQDMRLLVKLTLEMESFVEVITCSDGVEFFLDAFQDAPDMIMLDVMMELMSGPEIMKEIMRDERLSKLPIIFLTSRAEPEDIKKYMDLGAAGVIAKPFDITTFADRVQELWRRHYGLA